MLGKLEPGEERNKAGWDPQSYPMLGLGLNPNPRGRTVPICRDIESVHSITQTHLQCRMRMEASRQPRGWFPGLTRVLALRRVRRRKLNEANH